MPYSRLGGFRASEQAPGESLTYGASRGCNDGVSVESDSSPVRNPPSFGAEEPVYSTRRVTRSQQQPTPVTPKKYPLRQTRSSGSETEQAVDFSDRGTKGAARCANSCCKGYVTPFSEGTV